MISGLFSWIFELDPLSEKFEGIRSLFEIVYVLFSGNVRLPPADAAVVMAF
jgi:hypothetical protein